MKKELSALKMRMRERESDLGESADTSVHSGAKCSKMVTRLLTEAKQLQHTVKNLAAKLDLTGEQQGMLKKLMATTVIPEVPEEMLAKPKKAAAMAPTDLKKKKISKAAAKKAAGDDHNDLGESQDPNDDMPAELGEAAALEAKDESTESAKVEAAMRLESTKVAKRFAEDEQERQTMVQKAAVAAGKAIDKKMAEEDDALMKSDEATDLSMNDIIGSQKSLETEQALFRGTLSPDQVNQVVDPDIAQMEKEDLNDSADFQPMDEGDGNKDSPRPVEDEEDDDLDTY